MFANRRRQKTKKKSKFFFSTFCFLSALGYAAAGLGSSEFQVFRFFFRFIVYFLSLGVNCNAIFWKKMPTRFFSSFLHCKNFYIEKNFNLKVIGYVFGKRTYWSRCEAKLFKWWSWFEGPPSRLYGLHWNVECRR